MALPRPWLVRADEIIAILTAMGEVWVDRAMVEEIFHLRRRAAINLLRDVGAEERDSALQSPASRMLCWVLARRDEEAQELERRNSFRVNMRESTEASVQLRNTLVEHGRTPATFPVVAQVLSSSVSQLPAGVIIQKGRITINPASGSVEECMTLLHALSMALCNDLQTFTQVFAGEDCNPASHIDVILSELEYGKQSGLQD